MNLTVKDVRNLKFVNSEHDVIECEVNFNEIDFEEWTPFGASLNDQYEYGREIYARAMAGEFGVVAEYVAPPPVAKIKTTNLTDTLTSNTI